VRNLSFGGASQIGQDPRVSVVKANVASPTLLFTFLGRVSSAAGRELERVLAVTITAEGTIEFYAEADAWLTLADRKRAMRTTDVWKQQFASWGEQAGGTARLSAEQEFQPIAQSFIQTRRQELERERSRLAEWLQQRTGEIAGEPKTEQVVQISLFDQSTTEGNDQADQPNWMTMTDPAERLAAFHSDASQSVRDRSEADGVLRIYRQRLKVLEEQLNLGAPEVLPLGILMLVPEA
jgi:hypothetical protein